MALLNEAIFAVCLVALGLGPILYSTKVLRNDSSLYDPSSALYGQRSKESVSSASFGFVESSAAQSTNISDSEALVDSSISITDPTSTSFSTYEHASEDINQHDTLAQKYVLSNTGLFHPMKMSDLPLLSEATEVHKLAHLLYSSNIISPDATATSIGTRFSSGNENAQHTSDQAILRSITCSFVKATPSASLPEMTNSPTANAEALNSQTEAFFSKEPLHRRSPAQESPARKSIARTVLEVMQASVLILVGVVIGMSCSYFSTLLSRLRDHTKFHKDLAVQEGRESTSSQPSDECTVEVLIKHDVLVHPGILQAASLPQTLSNVPSLPLSPVVYFAVENHEETEDFPCQCKVDVVDPLVVSNEDIGIHGFNHPDEEESTPNALSMRSESGDLGDRMAEQFREEAVISTDEPDQQVAILDVPSQVDEEVNDIAIQIDEEVSEFNDQCAEVINTVIHTAPLLSDNTLLGLDDGPSHSVLSADASGAEGRMTNPLTEEITHFFMNSRYVPPHKRALDPQGKEYRKVVTVPSGCSLPEPEPLPKARQFQYDFFKGFLENFRRGAGASSLMSNSADGPAAGHEHDWRHRESKSVLSGRWHFSRLTARLNRVIEEDKDDEACEQSRSQNAADTEDSGLGRMASTSSCDTGLDGSITESMRSDPSCPLKEGSLSGNRFRVLSMAGCPASGELEKPVNPTPLQMVPSRVLLLHDDSKSRIRSYSDRYTDKELIKGEKESARTLELRELMRARGNVNQTDESGDF